MMAYMRLLGIASESFEEIMRVTWRKCRGPVMVLDDQGMLHDGGSLQELMY
jgi:hypothetical protein